MTHQAYAKQIDRLKNAYGDKNYAPERIKTLFTRLSAWTDEEFAIAVDNQIAKSRSAPLGEELLEELELVRKQKQADYYNTFSKINNPEELMHEAANVNQTADPEFVKACIKLLADKNSGKISMKQFLEGCDFLDDTAKKIKKRGWGK